MVNTHTVDYHPSPSHLISRIHPLISLWTTKRFISPESFFNFFLNLSIPPWLRKSFKFILLRLLENTFVSQKIDLLIFTHSPKQNSPPGFYNYPQGRRKKPITPEQRFLKIFFLQQKGGFRFHQEINLLLVVHSRGMFVTLIYRLILFDT